MSDLTVWGRDSSNNVQKVLWVLDEIGCDYRHIPAGGDFGGLDTPSFRALNPHGWVPVLRDGETVVWESGAVVRYLCAAYAEGTLWPGAPGPRALADQWMDWSQTTLQPAFMGFFWGWYRTPEDQRRASANARLIADAHTALGKLEQHLAGRAFVCGDALTMADLPAGSLLYRYFTLEIDRPSLPNVEAWYARLCDRPAYRARIMKPYGELKGRVAF